MPTYPDLISSAALASERYGDDHLEQWLEAEYPYRLTATACRPASVFVGDCFDTPFGRITVAAIDEDGDMLFFDDAGAAVHPNAGWRWRAHYRADGRQVWPPRAPGDEPCPARYI